MPEITNAGATPAVADATPAQNAEGDAGTQAATAANADTDPQPLGDAGKRALDAMKTERNAAQARAKVVERELSDLKAASLTDTEKAIADAKKAGAAETLTRVQAQIRRSETRAALTAAGINAGVLDLAVKADEFGSLSISDEGEIDGLGAAVETFKKAHGDLFRATTGSSDGGSRGAVRLTKEQALAWSKDPDQYEKHRDEILTWQAAQGR